MDIDGAPEILWHYTSMENFRNIMSSKTLWASHADHLNDPEERNLVFRSFEETVRKIWPESNLEDRIYHRDDRVRSRLAPFVVSFSANPDNLLLWRTYSGNMTGVAIGFRAEALRSAITDPPGSPATLTPMSYDAQEVVLAGQNQAIDVVRRVHEWRDGSKSPKHNEFWNWVTAYSVLSTTSANFKSPGWRQEEEWRLAINLGASVVHVSGENPQVDVEQFWKRRDDGRPYRELTIPDWTTAISRVVVGPWGDLEEASSILIIHGCNAVLSQSPTRVRP